MRLTASKLRADIYRILDQVLETGVPVEIERGGRILKLVPADGPPRGKLDRLDAHPGFLPGDPEEIVHVDWSGEWQP